MKLNRIKKIKTIFTAVLVVLLVAITQPFLVGATTIYIGESGTISAPADGTWTIINYSRTYSDPVVVGTVNTDINTTNGGAGGSNSAGGLVFQAQNVTTTSAEIRVCHTLGSSGNGCNAGSTANEVVAYMVIDQDAANEVGLPGIEAGEFSSDDFEQGDNDIISFTKSFDAAPLVLAATQTINSVETPAEARVENVTGTQFEAGICHQSTDDACLNNQTPETVGWVAINENQLVIDQVYDQGNTNMSNSDWTNISFTGSYTSPLLFVEQQTNNGGQNGEVDEARGVSGNSADVRFCEVDASNVCNSHTGEDMGWLAIESGDISYTNIDPPTLTTDPATGVTSAAATANGDIVDTGGENATERGFVYSTSSQSNPGNTSPNATQTYETGLVSNVSGWTTVNLSGTYVNPVVIVTGQESADGGDAQEESRAVVRNIASTSFQVNNFDDAGLEVTEDIGYIVMEEGRHTLDGVEVEAGTYTTSGTFATVSWSQSFTSSNVVVVDTIQEEVSHAYTSRFDNGTLPNSTGYTVKWESWDDSFGGDDGGGFEAGYIAINAGQSSSKFEGGTLINCSADKGTNDWCSASFANTYASVPLIFTNPIMYGGSDSTIIGHSSLTTTGVDLRSVEGDVGDTEQGHADEDIPWLVWESGDSLSNNPPYEFLVTETGSFGAGTFSSSLTGLDENTSYYYRSYARNSQGYVYGDEESFSTEANIPGAPTLTNPTTTTIDVTNDENSNPSYTEFAVQITSSDSTWNNQWVNALGSPSATEVWLTDSVLDAITLQGLDPGTTYNARSKARNLDSNETELSTTGSGTTPGGDANPPTPDPMTFASNPNGENGTSITMTATTATDAEGSDPVEYFFEYQTCTSNNGTGGTSSTWQTSATYVDTGLQTGFCYAYRVKARDAQGNETAYSALIEETTAIVANSAGGNIRLNGGTRLRGGVRMR